MNSLIAEFMGFQHTTLGWYDAEETLVNAENDNTFDELKFKTDWNWLMQVVEKCLIGEAELEPEQYKKYIRPIYEGLCNLDIAETHSAVVDFIKWYNKQK